MYLQLEARSLSSNDTSSHWTRMKPKTHIQFSSIRPELLLQLVSDLSHLPHTFPSESRHYNRVIRHWLRITESEIGSMKYSFNQSDGKHTSGSPQTAT